MTNGDSILNFKQGSIIRRIGPKTIADKRCRVSPDGRALIQRAGIV